MSTNIYIYISNFKLGAHLCRAPDLRICHTNLNDAKTSFIFLNGFWFQNMIGIAHAQIKDVDAHTRTDVSLKLSSLN